MTKGFIMPLNLLNDLAFTDFLTDISYQGRNAPTQQNVRGEFENADDVLENIDDIARGIVNQYIKLRLRDYIETLDKEPAFVLVNADEPDLPDWAHNVMGKGRKVFRFDGKRMSDKLKNEITTVRDYLFDVAKSYVKETAEIAKNTKHKCTIRYDYLKSSNELRTFDRALELAGEWHKKIANGLEQRLKSNELSEKSLVGATFVMELPNNMVAYQLTTPQALDFESDYMGHCVGRDGYDKGVTDGTTQIYSIRDKRGEPHVTFDVRGNSIKQVKGKQNKRPVSKYMPAVQAFVRAKKLEIDGDIKNTGLLKQDGEYYNIFDLPKNFVVNGDLDLSCMELEKLPDLSTVTVMGGFFCRDNKLTTLQGAPKEVGGWVNCGNNQLTTLQGAPEKVGGGFICNHNQLTTLQGAPKEVGGDFNCSNNQLTTLQGAPKEVGGGFNCSNNQLTTLQGAPEKVAGDFYCGNNKLTTLQGAPEKVAGGFYCHDNKLTTLQGAPKEVAGGVDCRDNKLTTLQGAPEKVGGDFNCSNNQLTTLQGAPEKVGSGFYCHDNKLTTLQGAPEKVAGDFYCYNNQLTTLQGAPKEVGGGFGCGSNQLTTLQGAPEKVGRGFYCYDNKLQSLDGKPKSYGRFSWDEELLSPKENSVADWFKRGLNRLFSQIFNNNNDGHDM